MDVGPKLARGTKVDLLAARLRRGTRICNDTGRIAEKRPIVVRNRSQLAETTAFATNPSILAALTISTIPTRTVRGKSDHAATTRASSPSFAR